MFFLLVKIEIANLGSPGMCVWSAEWEPTDITKKFRDIFENSFCGAELENSASKF